jgi:Flp pilus assembly protein TadG
MTTSRHLKRRGAAAAEMAILLPFVAFLFAVAVDFCRVYYASQTIQNCAYAAALYASGAARSDPDLSTPSAAASDAALAEAVSLNPPLLPANVAATVSSTAATVTVSYNFAFLTPFFGQSVTITRTVTMPVVPQSP